MTTYNIKEYLLMGLMQVQGHLNAGPSDPNTEAMVNALLDDTRSENLVVDTAANANVTAHHFGGEFQYESEAQEIGIIPDAALVCHVNNYVTVTVEVEDGAAGGKATIASIATTAANWAAGVPVILTLATNKTIPAGGVLSYKHVKAGDGVAVPVRCVYARVRKSKA